METNKITIEASKIDEYIDFVYKSINDIIAGTNCERDEIKILIPYYLIIAFKKYYHNIWEIEDKNYGKKTMYDEIQVELFGMNCEYNYENSIVVYHKHATLYNIEYFKKEI